MADKDRGTNKDQTVANNSSARTDNETSVDDSFGGWGNRFRWRQGRGFFGNRGNPDSCPCMAEQTPPCMSEEGPPCMTGATPPCMSEEGPPCMSGETPPCMSEAGPPCMTGETPPCMTDDGPQCMGFRQRRRQRWQACWQNDDGCPSVQVK